MYAKGNEPQEYLKYIEHLLKILHEAYPDGFIDTSTWQHENWDKLTEYVSRKLGYHNSIEFLEEYGFTVFGGLDTSPVISEDEPRSQPADRTAGRILRCPNCGSDNISIETFQENLGTTTVSNEKFKFREKGHGIIWWLLIGWWWWIIDLSFWVFFFPVRLVIQLFKKKKYKGKSSTVSQSVNEVVYKKMFTCHNCGNNWSEEAGRGSTMSASSKTSGAYTPKWQRWSD